jgi:hypothetical protein
MQRRDFIHLSACATAGLALTATFGCNNQQADIEAQPFFFSYLADSKTIELTGLAYRKTNTDENDKSKLSKLILAGSNSQTLSDKDAIRLMLENKVKNDFKTGKVVLVNGWVLSLTEARQCALFSIIQS